MPRYRLTEAATSDLDSVWLYVAEQGSIPAADHLIEDIVGRFPLLAFHPDMGRAREDFAPGLRSFPVGNYLIFYCRDADGVEIVRVLHSRRDLPRLFTH